MSKFTPFNLFIRQALLYPLTSPFLPAVGDVKLATSYAAGQKIGTYDPVPPPLEWQTDPDLLKTWADAVDYALHLEADGITVNEDPQNIWRLPTSVEIVKALSDQLFSDGSGVPGGFATEAIYWSSLVFDVDFSYAGNNIAFQTMCATYDVTIENNVRCVKI